MSFSVIYPHAAFVSIGANNIKPKMLNKSILADPAIVTDFDRVRVDNPGTGSTPEIDDATGRTWAFIFVGAGPLSGPETAALDAIVAAHTGVETNDPSPSNGGTLGQVWTNVDGTLHGWATPPGASGPIGGTTGTTDEAVLRANGPDGTTAQSSRLKISDDGVMTFPVSDGSPEQPKLDLYSDSEWEYPTHHGDLVRLRSTTKTAKAASTWYDDAGFATVGIVGHDYLQTHNPAYDKSFAQGDIDTGTNIITLTAHGWSTGNQVWLAPASNKLNDMPNGIFPYRRYYIRSQSSDTISIHNSSTDATNDANRRSLTYSGGVTTYNITRNNWHHHVSIEARDGSTVLGANGTLHTRLGFHYDSYPAIAKFSDAILVADQNFFFNGTNIGFVFGATSAKSDQRFSVQMNSDELRFVYYGLTGINPLTGARLGSTGMWGMGTTIDANYRLNLNGRLRVDSKPLGNAYAYSIIGTNGGTSILATDSPASSLENIVYVNHDNTIASHTFTLPATPTDGTVWTFISRGNTITTCTINSADGGAALFFSLTTLPPYSSFSVKYRTTGNGWWPIGGNSPIALTGDVTGGGAGSFATTIANDAVSYAKIQDVSAASRLLGRGSAGGAGDVEEITLGAGMAMTNGVLSSTGGAPGGVQGDLQFKGVSEFEGATGYKYDAATGLVVSKAEPITVSSTGWGMYADSWLRPSFTDPTRYGGFDVGFPRRIGFAATGGGETTLRALGGVASATAYGTAASSAFGTTNARTAEAVVTYTPAATANTGCSGAYISGTTARLPLNTDSSHGALRSRFSAKFSISGVSFGNARFFAGLAGIVTSFSADPTSSGSGLGTRMGIGFGTADSGVLYWITTQSSEANSVESTGITVTDGHMYYVEMLTIPNSAMVMGTLWRQTTAGGSWAVISSYSYDTTGNILSATSIGLAVSGGNGATASPALTVHVSHAMAEMR